MKETIYFVLGKMHMKNSGNVMLKIKKKQHEQDLASWEENSSLDAIRESANLPIVEVTPTLSKEEVERRANMIKNHLTC